MPCKRSYKRKSNFERREIPIPELEIGMIAGSDLLSPTGIALIRIGVRITDTMRIRLKSMAATGYVGKTMAVLVPPTKKGTSG